MISKWLLAFLLPLPLCAASAHAIKKIQEGHKEMIADFTSGKDHSKEPLATRKYMLADWLGTRTELAKRGVTVGAGYGFDSLQNPFGGVSQGYNYAGSYGMSATVDLDNYVKVCGLQFLISALYRSGTNLSERRIGNLFPVAQLFGGETFRLLELYLKQTLLEGRVLFKIGRLSEGNDFLVSPIYYNYVNTTFNNNPVAVFFNVPSYTSSSRATWGAYLSARLFESITTRWGIYNANSRIMDNRFHGANFTFKSTEGIQLTTEWEYLLHMGKQGLPGHYKIGLYYLTGSAEAFPSLNLPSNYAFYGHLDQTLYHPKWAKEKKGFTPWLFLMFCPDNRNIFNFFTMGGFIFDGPLAWRSHDALNFGVGYGSFSRTLRQLVRTNPNLPEVQIFGGIPPTYEGVVELNYSIEVTPWLVVVPDAQYVLRPLGTGTIRNALVVGLQLEAIF